MRAVSAEAQLQTTHLVHVRRPFKWHAGYPTRTLRCVVYGPVVATFSAFLAVKMEGMSSVVQYINTYTSLSIFFYLFVACKELRSEAIVIMKGNIRKPWLILMKGIRRQKHRYENPKPSTKPSTLRNSSGSPSSSLPSRCPFSAPTEP